ncbi:MAG: hypothetical protein ACOY40_02885 [Bacillota bacterium]
MDLKDQAVVEPAADEEVEQPRQHAPEEIEAPEGGNGWAGMTGEAEVKKEEAETAEAVEAVKVEAAAAFETKPAKKAKGNIFVDARYNVTVTAEHAQKPVIMPGPVMLPEVVKIYYSQFGLNDQAVEQIFQARTFDVPASKPVPAPPVNAGRRPRG